MGIGTADTAADAAIVDIRHRVLPQRVRIGLDGQRRTSGNTYTGMVASAGLTIDHETRPPGALPVLDRLVEQRFDAPLPIEHALALGDDHLQTGLGACQRLPQGLFHVFNTVSADRADPLDPGPATGLVDRLLVVPNGAVGVDGCGDNLVGLNQRGDVLPAGGRGITIVDDDQQAIVLVEHSAGHTTGQPVVPEPAVTHDTNRLVRQGMTDTG